MRRLTGIAIVVALVAAGCGGGEESSGKPAAAALLAAAVKSTDATESNLSEISLRSTLEGQEMTLDGRGVSAADQTEIDMTARFSEGDGPAQQMRMRIVDGESFIGGEILGDALPPGKKWGQIEDEEMTAPTMTPSEFVDFLRDNEDVEEVGREDVRGTPTVHLRGPVDVDRMLEESPDSPTLERLRQNPNLDELNMTVDVWVDEKTDLIARMALRMTVDGEPGEMTMTAEMIEYDVPLDFEAPPADQVAKLPG